MKKARKILVTGLISIMIANILFIPNEAKANSDLIASVQSLENDILSLGQQQVVLTQSVLQLLVQQELSIPNYERLTELQTSVQNNATLWLDGIKNQNQKVIQDMINFNNSVSVYYDPLVELAQSVNDDPESKNQLIFGLTLLRDKLKNIQAHTNDTFKKTEALNSTIRVEHDEFSTIITTATTDSESRLAGLSTELEDLKNTKTELIVGLTGSVIGTLASGGNLIFTIASISGPLGAVGGLGIIVGIAFIVGSLVGLAVISKQIHEINQQIAAKAREIFVLNQDVSMMEVNRISMDDFAISIDETVIQNVDGTISSVISEFDETIDNIRLNNSISIDYLVNDLFTPLRDSMQLVSDQSEAIQTFDHISSTEINLDGELYDQIGN
ncbi:HBL/NHE enterotoxin family protein [Chengkuizengella marina]|uniref:HBL/NHE enterotoxin family protein n=1 Tax=Chengkuizengella marina TaxID=2507566 RepID=UPI00136B4AB7|nr:HBL/NHE enterotoxin family protein [Chengkuizengella marina]